MDYTAVGHFYNLWFNRTFMELKSQIPAHKAAHVFYGLIVPLWN